MRLFIALLAFCFTAVCAAAQGYIEKEGVRMDIVDSFAVVDRQNKRLKIYLLPDKLSSDVKQRIINGNDFMVLSRMSSPDSGKWRWYPYARLELRNPDGKFSSRDDLHYFYLMAYGVNKQNYTDNLNGYFSKNDILGDYRFDGDRVRIQFTGKEEAFKINWHLDVSAPVMGK